MTVSSFRPRAHEPMRAVLWNGANFEEVKELFAGSALVRKLALLDGVLQISDTSSSEWYIKPGYMIALNHQISVYPEVEFHIKYEATP